MGKRITLDFKKVKSKKKGIVYRVWLREGRAKLASKQGFKRKKDAEQWAERKIEEIKNDRKRESLEKEKATRITFSVASSDYLTWGKPRWKKGTYGGKVGIYAEFIEFLHKHHPDGIDAELDKIPAPFIEQYMYTVSAMDGRSNKTGNRHRREIGAVWTHAITRGLMDGIKRTKQFIDNPVKDIKKFKVKKYSRHVPTWETVMLYRGEALPGDESDYVELMCSTIQRGISIRKLEWVNVHLAERKAVFEHAKRNGDTAQVWVYLNDTAYEILKRRAENRQTDSPFVFVNTHPYSGGGRYQRNCSFIKHLFHRIRERLQERLNKDIELVTGHALRHWGSHMLDKADVSREHIGKMLDHQRPETTEIYLDEMRVYEDVATALDEIGKKGLPKKQDHLKLVK